MVILAPTQPFFAQSFVLLVLSWEWMGMGVAGMIIITSDYGSFPHSLRLAPVSCIAVSIMQMFEDDLLWLGFSTQMTDIDERKGSSS